MADPPEVHNQDGFGVRFEWGEAGASVLAPAVDVLVVVDCLTYSTTVDVAVSRGAAVLPYRLRDGGAEEFAARHDAVCAAPRPAVGPDRPYSLSPPTVDSIPPGARLVLASPNGAAVTLAAAGRRARVLAGCLRNAAAVAEAARSLGAVVGVVAAGERWPDDTMRPAFEDMAAAGAVIERLGGDLSPEAEAARAAYRAGRGAFPRLLELCASGRELIGRGYPDDVRYAAREGVSRTVPVFDGEAFRAL